VSLLSTDLFVSGHYQYFFGYYPKAGILHPLHVIQTIIVTTRGLYLVYKRQKEASGLFRSQLRYCLLSLLIYTFAAVDYLCNYGYEFYPPGIFFITVGLSIFLYALLKKELMVDFHQAFAREHEEKMRLMKAVAGNIAHELRTPLATIRMDAQSARPFLPEELQDNIINTVHHANIIIDMLLANLRSQSVNHNDFQVHSMNQCIQKALDSYPFQKGEPEKITFHKDDDFNFYGSDTLLVYVLYNLLKNSLYSIARAMKGNIEIRIEPHDQGGTLYFRDTGTGITDQELPRIFEDFYSSKPNSVGNGLGLGFCARVMNSFGGRIEANSIEGEYCEFVLFFPEVD
jgi:signal transduction histidine kinase